MLSFVLESTFHHKHCKSTNRTASKQRKRNSQSNRVCVISLPLYVTSFAQHLNLQHFHLTQFWKVDSCPTLGQFVFPLFFRSAEESLTEFNLVWYYQNTKKKLHTKQVFFLFSHFTKVSRNVSIHLFGLSNLTKHSSKLFCNALLNSSKYET